MEGIPEKSSPLGPPGVPDAGMELIRDQRGEPVLEPLAPSIGERKIVGIGADPELAGRLAIAG
jgi:hypothetical protein